MKTRCPIEKGPCTESECTFAVCEEDGSFAGYKIEGVADDLSTITTALGDHGLLGFADTIKRLGDIGKN